MRSVIRMTVPALCAVALIAAVLCTAAFGALAEGSALLTESALADKMKGSWVGQMAGVCWAESTEFTALGRMLEPSEVPAWSPSMINGGGGQDDLYVEIPFLEAMRDHGFDCDLSVLADAFANSSFPLWHANNAARVNLKNGIAAPDSGSYVNNKHCDDIDWQIESDFIGQMCPGLVNEAIGLAWKTGHIMNYGDGVYGGVYVAAMHAAAYTASELSDVIEAGRLAIPEGSKFREVLDDVTGWYKQGKTYAETWQLLQDKWGGTDRCPDARGEENALNIDAKLNAAYCLIGLLYGNGDFEESMRIAMLCGQDSDCNPSTVGGILGNFYGFSKLPEKWTSALDLDTVFYATSMTFGQAIELNTALAKEVLASKGITVSNGSYTIPSSAVTAAELEQWPDQPILEITTKAGRMQVEAFANASDASGIKGYTWDFGDGKTGFGQTVTHTYAKSGTYTVVCKAESNKGTTATESADVLVDNNIASEGTPIVSETSPLGNGSRDIGIICDGVMPAAATGDYKLQYDTYAGVSGLAEGYVGYTFDTEQTFNTVVFQEGYHFADGGWFADGTMKVQIRQNGEWKDIDADIEPAYPVSDNYFDFGDPLEIYTFTFEPVNGDGVRLIGKPGGIWSFFSVSELRVLAPVPETPTPIDDSSETGDSSGQESTAESDDLSEDGGVSEADGPSGQESGTGSEDGSHASVGDSTFGWIVWVILGAALLAGVAVAIPLLLKRRG
ncbi:MAG: ADP-ribosylglycohydrolase family protein [Clostridia bacterium]|nr:ADP-ribosylglycohydrolase family protein [Clostridia bacterium]